MHTNKEFVKALTTVVSGLILSVLHHWQLDLPTEASISLDAVIFTVVTYILRKLHKSSSDPSTTESS